MPLLLNRGQMYALTSVQGDAHMPATLHWMHHRHTQTVHAPNTDRVYSVDYVRALWPFLLFFLFSSFKIE